MRPISVLNLIILGSCIAISVCLVAVWGLLYLTSLEPEHAARVGPELKLIPKHIAIFIPQTIISALSFLSSQKRTAYWWAWQIFMWGAVSLTCVYYVKIL